MLLGSHRSSLAHWDTVLTPEQKRMLPRVHGLTPSPKPGRASFPEHVPPPDDGGPPWEERAPTPMVAKRGQILVLCSSALHSAWRARKARTRFAHGLAHSKPSAVAAENEDGVARKAMGGGSWIPVGVGAGLPQNQFDARQAFIPELRKRLPAERKHIAHEGDFFVSGYDEKWAETFQPNVQVAKMAQM